MRSSQNSLENAQAILRKYIPGDRKLSEELIQEPRELIEKFTSIDTKDTKILSDRQEYHQCLTLKIELCQHRVKLPKLPKLQSS